MQVVTSDATVIAVGGSIAYEIIVPHTGISTLVQLIHPRLLHQLGSKGLELNLKYDIEKMAYLKETQPDVVNPFDYVMPPEHYVIEGLVRKLTVGDPWKYEDCLKKMLVNKARIMSKAKISN